MIMDIDMADMLLAAAESMIQTGDIKDAEEELLLIADSYRAAGSEKYLLTIALLSDINVIRGELDDALQQRIKFKLGCEGLFRLSGSPEHKYRLAVAWQSLGDLRQRKQKLDNARHCFEQSLNLMDELCQNFPENRNYQNARGIANSRIGDVLAGTGFHFESISFYQKHLNQILALGKPAKADINIRHSLAAAISKLAEAYLANGDYRNALASLKEQVTAYEGLATDFPNLLEHQDNAGISYEKIGSYYLSVNRPSSALEPLEKAISLYRRLTEKYSLHKGFKLGLLSALEKKGNVLQAMGDPVAALDFYARSLALITELGEGDRTLPLYRHRLAVSYGKDALILSQLGRESEALNRLMLASSLLEELILEFPVFTAYRESYSVVCDRLGDYFREKNDHPAAQEHYQRYHEECLVLLKLNPHDVDHIHTHAISCSKLGLTLLETRPGDALSWLSKYLSIEKKLHRKHPDNLRFKRSLSLAYAQMGKLMSILNDIPGALKYLLKYHRHCYQLFYSDRANVLFKDGYAVACLILGEVWLNAREPLRAIRCFKKYHCLLAELSAAYPKEPEYVRGAAAAAIRLYDALNQQKQVSAARKVARRSIRNLEQAIDQFPLKQEFNRILAAHYLRIGEGELKQNHVSEAVIAFLKQSDILKVIWKTTRDDSYDGFNLAVSYESIGAAGYVGENFSLAAQWFSTAKQMWQKLRRKHQGHLEFQHRLALSYFKAGVCFRLLEQKKGLIMLRTARAQWLVLKAKDDNPEYVCWHKEVDDLLKAE